MSTARQRSAFRGVNKLRRTLRRLEPESLDGIKAAFKRGAETIHFDAISNAMGQGIYDTGDMVASIAINYGRDGLTAVIGPGADTVKINKSPFNTTLYVSNKAKTAAWNFFKAYWAEFGTKGYPAKNIPPQPARPFMAPAFDSNKDRIAREVQREIRMTLQKVSSGPDE